MDAKQGWQAAASTEGRTAFFFLCCKAAIVITLFCCFIHPYGRTASLLLGCYAPHPSEGLLRSFVAKQRSRQQLLVRRVVAKKQHCILWQQSYFVGWTGT